MGSSSVPSTWLWLARICSISVEPERGSPTMKIGASDSKPSPACASRNSRLKTSDDLLVAGLEAHRVVGHQRPLPLVAAVIVRPGAVVVAGVLVGLGEGEVEVDDLALRQVLPLQLLLHGRDLFRLEPEDLEVRHAPVDLAELGLQRDRRAVLAQRLRLLAEGLQRMRIAHVDARQAGLQFDRARIGGRALSHVADLRVVRAEALTRNSQQVGVRPVDLERIESLPGPQAPCSGQAPRPAR